jgi:hypothetical protein
VFVRTCYKNEKIHPYTPESCCAPHSAGKCHAESWNLLVHSTTIYTYKIHSFSFVFYGSLLLAPMGYSRIVSSVALYMFAYTVVPK